MNQLLNRIWHSLSDFSRTRFVHVSSKESPSLGWPQYPSEPPTVSLSLSLSSDTCSPGENIQLHLSIFNETPFPITVGNYSSSILAVRRSARVDHLRMIEVRDAETGLELPRMPYVCVGGEIAVTKDYEECFLTIPAFSTHVETEFFVKHDELEVGHVYVVTFSNPRLPWWQYGTKEEVLMPGTEEEEEIWRRTGKDPSVHYEAYGRDPYCTKPDINIRITGQPPRLLCL